MVLYIPGWEFYRFREMQYGLVLELTNEAIAQYLRCVFLYNPDSKINGRYQADSAVDALGIRKQWVLNETNNANRPLHFLPKLQTLA